jgi:hypothetical protein
MEYGAGVQLPEFLFSTTMESNAGVLLCEFPFSSQCVRQMLTGESLSVD